jgi:Membrane carboxypeptidase/penicillin-binding protein
LFLGEEQLLSILNTLNITDKATLTASMPLGTYETNIINLTGAYSSLANGGYLIKPHTINKVTDIEGHTIYKFKKNKKRVLDPSITFIISELLTSTYNSSLADYTYPTCINILPMITNKYAIKSGSTDTDAWVIGYNKDYVLSTWSGYDDNSKIENEVVSSNKISWATTFESFLKDKKSKWLKIPDNVTSILVEPISGKPATSDTKNATIAYYIKGTEPK